MSNSLTSRLSGLTPKRVRTPPENDAPGMMTLFVMVVATLYFGKEVLVPITLALLLAFILAPLVELLRRLRLGRVPSVLLGVVLALGLVLSLGAVIGAQIAQLSSNIPQYSSTIETKVEAAKSYTVGRISRLTDRIGAHRQADAAPGASHADGGSAPPAAIFTQAHSSSSSESPIELATTYLTPILSPLATFGIVFVVAIFALLQREDLRDRLIRLLGSDDLHRTTAAIDEGARRLSKYFVVQLLINTTFGVVVGVGLLLIGVPNPVLWGILSALLRFVPYVGSFISAVLPMALAAAVAPGWSMVVWTVALYVVVEGITGQVIEPLVYGHSTGLSPFSVVVAAIFWSWVWGPVGLILSTPLTLCLVVMGRHIERLEFLDVLLGDTPPLTPVESFYQRILAKDADEAQEQAEALLEAHTLTAYYDEVALRGLQMAVADAKRGALETEQIEAIKLTVQQLIEGLARHEDVLPPDPRSDKSALDPSETETMVSRNPPPNTLDDGTAQAWKSASSVMCVAGRGPLDEAAAEMLTQLLEKHGIGATMLRNDAVARGRAETLNVTGVAMVCVMYLDVNGSPAHLRYLVQRVRRQVGGAVPIMVGLFPADSPALRDDKVRQAIGADHLIGSLTEAVNLCVKTAQAKPALPDERR